MWCPLEEKVAVFDPFYCHLQPAWHATEESAFLAGAGVDALLVGSTWSVFPRAKPHAASVCAVYPGSCSVLHNICLEHLNLLVGLLILFNPIDGILNKLVVTFALLFELLLIQGVPHGETAVLQYICWSQSETWWLCLCHNISLSLGPCHQFLHVRDNPSRL